MSADVSGEAEHLLKSVNRGRRQNPNVKCWDMIQAMLIYDTLSAVDLVSKAQNHNELNLALQVLAKGLGYKEALYWSKYSTMFSPPQLDALQLADGLLALLVAQNKLSFEQSKRHFAQHSLSAWVQREQLTEEANDKKIAYAVHCSFTQNANHCGAAVFIVPSKKFTAATLSQHAPYIAHITQMVFEKLGKLRPVSPTEADNAINPLTVRELAILRLSAEGKIVEEISSIMGISARTVNFDITQIMNVLGVPNKTAAVAKAIFYGWIL
jgi:DNA-binding CsgD family transcriptional regulator